MPYVRCWACGLTTYCARGQLGRAECPSCGSLLLAPAPAGNGSLSADDAPAEGIGRALELAQRELDMDAALLTEIRDGQEIVRRGTGRLDAFGVTPGRAMALEDTYCERLLTDGAADLVRDTRRDPRTRDLPVTAEAGIGAYIGVRLTAEHARLYVLCCLAHESRPALGEADLRFLRGLAESVSATLRERR